MLAAWRTLWPMCGWLLLVGMPARYAEGFGLGLRPSESMQRQQHHLQQHEQTSACQALPTTYMSEETRSDAAVGRGSFLRNSAAFLAGGGLVASVRPDSASAIGELFEFKQQARFAQHATVQVPDMAAALRFFVQGVGMEVIRTRAGPQFNTTVVGFGPEALQVPPDFVFGVSSMRSYGGHFTLELNSQKEVGGGGEEDVDFFYDPGNGVQFVQIAVESYRISQVIKAGGIVESGYGFLQVLAPGGLRIKLLAGERRDPPMFVGVKVKDMKRSIKWYTDIAGMSVLPYPKARAPGSPFEPDQPKNSVFMAYEGEAFGVLLLPAEKGENVNPGSAFSVSILAEDVDKVAGDLGGIVSVDNLRGGTRFVSTSDPDGYSVKFIEYEDWKKELPPFRRPA